MGTWAVASIASREGFGSAHILPYSKCKGSSGESILQPTDSDEVSVPGAMGCHQLLSARRGDPVNSKPTDRWTIVMDASLTRPDGAPRAALMTAAIGALGVVFGDIGTSPLYTLKTV